MPRVVRDAKHRGAHNDRTHSSFPPMRRRATILTPAAPAAPAAPAVPAVPAVPAAPKHPARGTRHAARGTRHAARGTRHAARGTRHVVDARIAESFRALRCRRRLAQAAMALLVARPSAVLPRHRGIATASRPHLRAAGAPLRATADGRRRLPVSFFSLPCYAPAAAGRCRP
ncbi:hypothetical protein BMAA1694 [Burkholderia mallei ATCC 23344]|uniref:Uncharacterized protein n=1 Tax=Burkholderia mallei (strain ATCC 23344) TaxID=243160 RepID=A0A0H2WB30_BURMA|nr:hypothetical protein BMAA1694 [Burkholderia mallei ATCC 23344]RPA20345.1 hypothetical protein EGT61_001370 [Burkholderia mallei]